MANTNTYATRTIIRMGKEEISFRGMLSEKVWKDGEIYYERPQEWNGEFCSGDNSLTEKDCQFEEMTFEKAIKSIDKEKSMLHIKIDKTKKEVVLIYQEGDVQRYEVMETWGESPISVKKIFTEFVRKDMKTEKAIKSLIAFMNESNGYRGYIGLRMS